MVLTIVWEFIYSAHFSLDCIFYLFIQVIAVVVVDVIAYVMNDYGLWLNLYVLGIHHKHFANTNKQRSYLS